MRTEKKNADACSSMQRATVCKKKQMPARPYQKATVCQKKESRCLLVHAKERPSAEKSRCLLVHTKMRPSAEKRKQMPYKHLLFFLSYSYRLPVEPNPPLPRTVSDSSSDSTSTTGSFFSMSICATRSPAMICQSSRTASAIIITSPR